MAGEARAPELAIAPLRIARRNAAFERDYLRSVFARSEGNVTRAAIAEVSRQMIQN